MLALNRRIGDLTAQLAELAKVLAEQQAIKKAMPSQPEIDQTIVAINARIDDMQKELRAKDGTFSKYLTSIRPNDRDLYITARKASEIYPRVPYYIAGTPEIGEFWVEPGVDDSGKQVFTLNFVDPSFDLNKVRSEIRLSATEAEDLQKGLFRVREWSKTAHDDKIRKSFEKRVTCFPEADCPPDGQTLDGKLSTELRFIIYEDGSTAGRIQRNKGRYVEGFNFSIDSGLLLQAYLAHVIKEASLDFRQGTYSREELDKLFK